jgi:hypothetical protein
MDQNEEHDNPKNAADHFQHFHSLVRLFASLDWNCNDNRVLGRGSARKNSFPVHPKNADEKAGEDGLKAKGNERCARYNESHGASVIQIPEAS